MHHPQTNSSFCPCAQCVELSRMMRARKEMQNLPRPLVLGANGLWTLQSEEPRSTR